MKIKIAAKVLYYLDELCLAAAIVSLIASIYFFIVHNWGYAFVFLVVSIINYGVRKIV